MVDIQQFLKERDEAMFSLDKSKILAYCQKYQVPLPKSCLLYTSDVYKRQMFFLASLVLIISGAP